MAKQSSKVTEVTDATRAGSGSPLDARPGRGQGSKGNCCQELVVFFFLKWKAFAWRARLHGINAAMSTAKPYNDVTHGITRKWSFPNSETSLQMGVCMPPCVPACMSAPLYLGIWSLYRTSGHHRLYVYLRLKQGDSIQAQDKVTLKPECVEPAGPCRALSLCRSESLRKQFLYPSSQGYLCRHNFNENHTW